MLACGPAPGPGPGPSPLDAKRYTSVFIHSSIDPIVLRLSILSFVFWALYMEQDDMDFLACPDFWGLVFAAGSESKSE